MGGEEGEMVRGEAGPLAGREELDGERSDGVRWEEDRVLASQPRLTRSDTFQPAGEP